MSALIWLAYLSLFVLSLLDNLRGPFYSDILLDLQLNGKWGSLFFATTSLFAFVGSWTGHHIVQRRSAVYLMSLASLIIGIGFAWMSRAGSLVFLLPACALFGLGFGALNLAQNLMVFEGAAASLRRRIFSGLHGMYGLAALVAPMVASLFRWLDMSWRGCFLAMATLPVLIAVAGVGWRSEAKAKAAKPQRLTRAEWFYCALFSLMMAFYLWGEISISTRIVHWLRTDLNYTPDLANFYLGAFSLTLLAGRVFFGVVHLKSTDNWRILLYSSGLATVVYFLGLVHSPNWFIVCGLVMAPFFPVAMEQVSVTFGTKAAEALGFVLGAGSLSVVLMHLTIGALADAFGVGRALFIGPLSLLVVAVGLGVKTWRKAPLVSP